MNREDWLETLVHIVQTVIPGSTLLDSHFLTVDFRLNIKLSAGQRYFLFKSLIVHLNQLVPNFCVMSP